MSKKFFFAGFLVVIFSLVLFTTTWAAYGLEETARTAGLNTGLKLPTLIGNVIGTALSLIGVIFFALMIFGGFLWMTAHGKEEQAKQGMDTVIAAVIGLIIILAAYAITNFVFSSVGGTATTGGGGGGGDESSPSNCCTYCTQYGLVTPDCSGQTEEQCKNLLEEKTDWAALERTNLEAVGCLMPVEQPPETTINQPCDSNADCIDSICKKGKCAKGVSCNTGEMVAGICNYRVCGSEGDKCSSNSQCESNHCVKGYCETGGECAACVRNSDCQNNFYCNSRGYCVGQ